eukprot:TRINITY_DN2083_c0_g2_i1.p1 TRINITY_DN2083_c0_g2~~TRINITY_DN2083_c0_g2_i1.p1  ORF type:complete len:396 (+),score=78.97 TRINITY_DN2083_c0_g2_i1:116-1303(+)
MQSTQPVAAPVGAPAPAQAAAVPAAAVAVAAAPAASTPAAPVAPAGAAAPPANGQAASASAGTTTKCSKCGQTQQALKAANLRLKPCPCRKAQYCNQDCQKDDWKRHKTECTYSRPRAKPAQSAEASASKETPAATGNSGAVGSATAVQQPQQQQQQQAPHAQPLKSPNIPPAQNPSFEKKQMQPNVHNLPKPTWGGASQRPSTSHTSTPAAPQQSSQQTSQPPQPPPRAPPARAKLGSETQGLVDKNNLNAVRQLIIQVAQDLPGLSEIIELWARRQPQLAHQVLQPTPMAPILQQGMNQMASPMLPQQMLSMQPMGLGLQHPLMMPGISLIPNTNLAMGNMAPTNNPSLAGLQAANTSLQGQLNLQGSPFQLATGGVISPIASDSLRFNHQGR